MVSRIRSRGAFALALTAGLLSAAGCAGGSAASGGVYAANFVPGSGDDPRLNLAPGLWDAGEAAWGLRHVVLQRPSEFFDGTSDPSPAVTRRTTNSDLSFVGNFVIQGNYSGYQVWDVTTPAKPKLHTAYICPGSQGDVSVYGNLLFMSSEDLSGRTDCGTQGVGDPVSHDRLRGIRIFDITDIANPRPITGVQTCRGSHTHTVVTDPRDRENVYIYVSGSGQVRSAEELEGCADGTMQENENTALFRIEVIQVPLAAPQNARIVSSPRIFSGLTDVVVHDDTSAAGRTRVTTQCHDITVYGAVGLGAGACAGYGLLLDISDVRNPKRIAEVSDPNFAAWHSATFSNDGSKLVFTDEWGGGGAPRCRATDRKEWGADAIFTRNGAQLELQSYYKLPAAQTVYENCVAHNGSLLPIPGRDIKVQSWYQGGISIFEFTDPKAPREIGFFDRGPYDGTKLVGGGHWSTYWYNGYIYSSEMRRGLDILELVPNAYLSANEIAASKLIHFDFLNVQDQPQLVWPAAFVVSRAYVDQLARNGSLPAGRIVEIRADLDRLEGMSGRVQEEGLRLLAARLEREAEASTEPARVRMLVESLGKLADAAAQPAS